MTETLESGSLRPRNINRTFGICYKLSMESGDKDRKTFIKKVRNACESYIFANRNSMFVQNLCDDRFISYIYLYSELGSILESTLHPEVINFFFSFLDVVGKGQVLSGNFRSRNNFCYGISIMKLILFFFLKCFSSKRFNAARENQLYFKCINRIIFL